MVPFSIGFLHDLQNISSCFFACDDVQFCVHELWEEYRVDYNILLDMTADLGYRLAMAGAETFRVEESVARVLASYGLGSEVFAIPNCLIVSIETDCGKPMTRMRRIGAHGNDLESVERYSNLSRRLCDQRPDPQEALLWLKETEKACAHYRLPVLLLGYVLSAAGFSLFFGGTPVDFLCAGVCGLLIGLVDKLMTHFSVNQFFHTIFAAFLMAVAAYAAGAVGIASNADTVVIGALMLLVPGLLFTNAMRDIIFGDTNSGINRIVQVFLIAAALAIGTGTAWYLIAFVWKTPASLDPLGYSVWIQCIAAFIGCIGFSIYFNIHGWGMLLCVLGGALAWLAYSIFVHWCGSSVLANFGAAVIASAYAETMARIRKYPAISYLVVSLFPLLPGAGIYYSANRIAQGDMAGFASIGSNTIAVAAALAVGVLLVSTAFRSWTLWKRRKIAH